MITYKQLKKAINDKLKGQFSLEINSNDVKEGFIRPSFFVAFDNQNRSSTTIQVEKSLTIRIYYFPEDQYDYSMEILDVQEQLEELFDLKLKVLDRFLNINEVDAVVTDGVLEFSFDIEFSYARDVEYGYTIVEVDEGGNPTPVEVPVDENGNPIVDKEGRPIAVELMEILELDKE